MKNQWIELLIGEYYMIRSKILFSTLALLLLLSSPAIPTGQSAETPSPATLDDSPIVGTVLETMNSGGYTYLQVAAEQGNIWVAIPETKIEKGQEVRCAPGMEMRDFSSTTLGRSFASIIFSPGIGEAAKKMNFNPHKQSAPKAQGGSNFQEALKAEQGTPVMGGEAVEAMGESSGSTGAIVPAATVSVEKAEGENSYQIGDCFEQAKTLSGKTVRVQGKVMKVSRMIMGKNWIHLQDGSGNPMQNSHDLVVTTMAEPTEGSVVTVEGVLQADKDFGFGYKYAVIIEDANIK